MITAGGGSPAYFKNLVMLQAKDCRIGNWVNFHYSISGETKPVQIFPSWFNNDADIRDSSPIPITPEILMKCGATEEGIHGQSWISYRIGDFIYDLTDPQLSKGLHWFQNYHYFKTGEELQINL